MTRKEALEILDTIPTIGDQVDALEMAIKALEQEPCEELDFVQPHKKIPVNLEVCKMREATQEEREGVEQYINSIAEPCVAHQICHEDKVKVLGKIRAEIDAHREKLKVMADDDWYAGKIRGYDCAIEIIDKCTAEGSDEE